MVTDTLERTKRLVWPEIQKYLVPQIYPDVFKIPTHYKTAVENAYWLPLKDYPERKGKYIRATIVRLVAECLGAKDNKTVKTASAMQISEDWLLIHDDWEDNSTLRRGKPALHRIFGDKLSINAGDALHMIMWKVLIDNQKLLGKEKAYSLLNEFYTILSRTALGQAVEIYWMENGKDKMVDQDWYFIADGKTSYYTMAGPARLGGIIGNATQKQLDALTEFGFNLGRCFQLVDDLLDLTTDFSGLKEQANDIYEGKRTLMLGHLSRNLPNIDLKKLDNILAKSRDKKTKKEVGWVLNKMKKYGSIDYGWKVAKKFKKKALEIFDKKLGFLRKEPARSQLKELIDFILERKY